MWRLWRWLIVLPTSSWCRSIYIGFPVRLPRRVLPGWIWWTPRMQLLCSQHGEGCPCWGVMTGILASVLAPVPAAAPECKRSLEWEVVVPAGVSGFAFHFEEMLWPSVALPSVQLAPVPPVLWFRWQCLCFLLNRHSCCNPSVQSSVLRLDSAPCPLCRRPPTPLPVVVARLPGHTSSCAC